MKPAYNSAMLAGPLSRCGEFALSASEAAYREEHLPEFLRYVRVAFCCAVFLNLLFLFSDWRFYGHTHFYFAIVSRAVITITSLVCLAASRGVRSFRHLEFLNIAWSCLVIPASAILVSPHTDIALLVTFILPVIFYLVIPLPFRWTLFFGLACSAAALGAYMSSSPVPGTGLGLVIGMVMSNTVLALVLIQSSRLRRLEWSAAQAEHVANQELSERRDVLQKILKAIPAPFLITARDTGELIQANDTARQYFGADLLKSQFQIERYIGQSDWAKLDQRLRSDGQASGFEARLHLPGGSARDVLLAATDMVVSGTKALLTVFVDITLRKEIETMMEKLANTDALSGLPNRARFFTVATAEIRRAQRYNRPLAVFMVDIDLFKRINDAYGHDAGDLALKEFAQVCRTWVRSQDLVARLGGEEFGFLLPETDAETALALANRLRAEVESMRMDKILTPITISIGISEVMAGEVTVDAALSRADQALYAAKKSGRNRALLYDCATQASNIGVQ
jgi:diguanylate cyclase (GGDEF)-like protein